MPDNISLSRLKAMIHYIVDRAPYRALGKVKLNKILWFADRAMYLHSGKTISGDTYLRFPQGPVSRHLLAAQEELQAERKIHIRWERMPAYEQYFYLSLEDPDISAFDADEIDAINRSLDMIAPLTARQASELSHDRTWETFANGEEIPMYAVLAADTREPTPEDIAWAESVE